ncbi:MAG TPA: hypothetical protein VNB22_08810 [Pyrinomonadaceae bacterium]|nr:hypothetical protein [Pyrinomonadaceae bacterium]
MDIRSNHGYLSDITPTRLSKKDLNHGWIFAIYIESPPKRDDGRDYKAFTFRNAERTIFGLKEYWDWQIVDFRKLATRVIQDKEFRKSLISSDPDLLKIWKRH